MSFLVKVFGPDGKLIRTISPAELDKRFDAEVDKFGHSKRQRARRRNIAMQHKQHRDKTEGVS